MINFCKSLYYTFIKKLITNTEIVVCLYDNRFETRVKYFVFLVV